MPLLNYSSADFPFQPFTKIYSADINQCYNDIKTLLNTTGLDNTNVQNAGLSVGKLKIDAATAGQFVSNNGTIVLWSPNPLLAQYNVIVGSAAQVTAGTATTSTFASYTQADGDRVLVLPGYTTNESWTITKKLFISGLGYGSQIQGAVTFNSGSSYSLIKGISTLNNITLALGVSGVYAEDVWFSGTNTFVDNNTSPSNLLFAMQG